MNSNAEKQECFICNNYGQSIDSQYGEYHLMGYGDKDFTISSDTCNIEEKFIFNFCPICGRNLNK